MDTKGDAVPKSDPLLGEVDVTQDLGFQGFLVVLLHF